MMTVAFQDSPEWQITHHVSGTPFGQLNSSQAKEQFSLAYLHAVATSARCTLSDPKVDNERVDVTIRQTASHTLYSSANVDVQLKCSSLDIMKSDGIHFKLDGDHYNDLADPKRYDPVILVVLHVPRDPSQWLSYPGGSPASGMTLKNVAHWVSLNGANPTTQGTKTVVLPKANVFDVSNLLGILSRIGNGRKP